jgi:hypothetical protein
MGLIASLWLTITEHSATQGIAETGELPPRVSLGDCTNLASGAGCTCSTLTKRATLGCQLVDNRQGRAANGLRGSITRTV